MFLSLEGDALRAVTALGHTPASLDQKGNGNDIKGGYEMVMEALDATFLANKTTQAFCAFKAFIEYRRESGQSFSKFIIEYETRYREIVKADVRLDV